MEGDSNSWQPDPMRYYRSKRDAAHQTVTSKYKIVGFISSGTYGRVYKAISKDGTDSVHAIKKFKPDKEGDVVTYTGISQSAIREIAVGPHPHGMTVSRLMISVEQGDQPREHGRHEGSYPRRQIYLYGL